MLHFLHQIQKYNHENHKIYSLTSRIFLLNNQKKFNALESS
jgi:hypothetical protein